MLWLQGICLSWPSGLWNWNISRLCGYWLSCHIMSQNRPFRIWLFERLIFADLYSGFVPPSKASASFFFKWQMYSLISKECCFLYEPSLHQHQSSSVSLYHAGLLSEKHPEEHGVHLSPWEKLHHQQGHPQPLPVLSTAEVPGSRNVQGVWVHLPYTHNALVPPDWAQMSL